MDSPEFSLTKPTAQCALKLQTERVLTMTTMMIEQHGQRIPLPKTHLIEVRGRIDAAMVDHIRAQLEHAADADVIELDIRSDGGEFADVWDAIGLIQDHPAKKVGIVKDHACSGGAFLFVACDERKLWRDAVLMLHGPQPQTAEAVEDSKHIAGVMGAFVSRRTRNDAAGDWFRGADVWFTSGEAVKAGLATEIVQHVSCGARFAIPEGARRYVAK